MNFAPLARIALRYIIGAILGSDLGNILAADPDVVSVAALGIGLGVEAAYGLAKKRGWAT